MNHYRRLNRVFAATVVTYLLGVNLVAFFFPVLIYNADAFSILAEMIVFLVPFIYCMRNHLSMTEDLGFRPISVENVLWSILFICLLRPAVMFISMISALFLDTSVLESATETMAGGGLFMALIVTAVVPAITEEIVFRGVFYQGYRKHGILIAIGFSSLLFSLIHLNFFMFIYTFVLGVAFCFLVEATGSVWSSVIAHAVFNGYSVVVTMIEEQQLSLMTEAEQEAYYATSAQVSVFSYVYYGIAAVGCGVLCYVVYKKICKINQVELTAEKLTMHDKVRRVTVPLVIGVLICLAYMVFLQSA